MLEAARRKIMENRLLHPGDRVLVAISGGIDSVCLLHLLRELATDLSISVQAAHLDHRLRPESGADAVFVQELCDRWSIPLVIGEIDVAAEARTRKSGLEETARMVRRAFLQATAKNGGCPVIALAHHRGDQAETVLHRLVRGSGATGLAGMRPQEGPFIRPLLDVSRQQIHTYMQQNRLAWVEDLSNLDHAFTRNRLRHSVLPLLAEFNPRIEEHLARLGHRFGLEEEFWQQEVAKVLTTVSRADGNGIFLDCLQLGDLHPALRARVLREALRQVRGDLQRISAAHLAQLEFLLHSPQPQGETHLPGAWAGRRYGRLWLRSTPPILPVETVVDIPGPGTFSVPGGVLRVSYEAKSLGEGPLAVEFDPSVITFPLRVRNYRSGDRFRPDGMAGRKKVKNFFIDAKLDREARRRILLVEGSEILWLIGYRRSNDRRPGEGAVLRLHFHPLAGDNFDC